MTHRAVGNVLPRAGHHPTCQNTIDRRAVKILVGAVGPRPTGVVVAMPLDRFEHGVPQILSLLKLAGGTVRWIHGGIHVKPDPMERVFDGVLPTVLGRTLMVHELNKHGKDTPTGCGSERHGGAYGWGTDVHMLRKTGTREGLGNPARLALRQRYLLTLACTNCRVHCAEPHRGLRLERRYLKR